MTPAATRRLRLIHWNEEESAARAAHLAKAGWAVERSLPPGPVLFRELRQAPPDAIVIDLTRLPSQGRDVALTIRQAAATRRVPLVFIEGDPEKTDKVRTLLPDAVYTTWERVRGALRDALAKPPVEPVKPAGVFAGYAGTPLPKKLGMKPGMTVALISPPEDFARTLGPLPEGTTLLTGTRRAAGLVIWFVRTAAELAREVLRIAEFAGDAQLWIAWRKKSAAAGSSKRGARERAAGPTEPSVRAAGLAIGLVDFKICAIDETWSGLLFTRRKPK